MRNRTASASDSTTLVMNRRRWTAYFTLPFAVVFAIAGIAIAPIAYDHLPGSFGIAVAGLSLLGAACVAIPMGRSSWIALTNREPALIVDSRGIADHFHLNAFLPWSDIKSASVDYGENSLSIVLRDGATAPGGTRVAPSLTRTLKRAFTGSDLQIPLRSLSYDHNKLRALLTWYSQVRRHPSS